MFGGEVTIMHFLVKIFEIIMDICFLIAKFLKKILLFVSHRYQKETLFAS